MPVAVLDDGVQYDHPDLNVDRSLSFGWDLMSGTRVSTANDAFSQHGTATAGVVAAIHDNGNGGCGVASDATLVAVKLLNSGTSDMVLTDDVFVRTLSELRNLSQVVVSNSWGPPDDGRVDGPGVQGGYFRVDEALRDFTTTARQGRGGVVVFAAGNGGPYDNANDDGFAAHAHTITVGSVGDDNRRTAYSEPGACIDVVAPSDGGWRGITTTDLTGSKGYSTTNTTAQFGGTSAATPVVAAIVAMMLHVRPELSARDVRHILVTTAQKNDPDDTLWTINQAGLGFHPFYGFGIVDAYTAVTTSAGWEPLPTAVEECSSLWSGYLNLATTVWTSVPFTGLKFTYDYVESVRVFVDVDHTWRGDVLLRIVSPAGTVGDLTFAVPRTVPLYHGNFVPHDYLARGFLGETSTKYGWSLHIRDLSASGRLKTARICVRGLAHAPPPPIGPAPPPDFAAYAPPPPSSAQMVRVAMWATVGSLFACGFGCLVAVRCIPNGISAS